MAQGKPLARCIMRGGIGSSTGMASFAIDPDVARAATIDERFYLDDEVWQLARERVFARSCWPATRPAPCARRTSARTAAR